MDYILLLFLPMILFIGGITSYQDRMSGKIRNKWILLGLSYAFVMNILIILYYIFFNDVSLLRLTYFIELIINVIFALILGFILWDVGIWTAGDAKLFMVFSALIPLSVFHYGHVPYFDASNVLINTFIPFFIIYALILLFKTTIKQKIFYLKKSLEFKQLIFLFLFGFIWPLNIFFKLIHLPSNYFFSIFILFIILTIIEKMFKNSMVYILVCLSVLRIIFDKTIFTLQPWFILIIIFISFILLRYFILYMGYDYMTKYVDIKLLKKGMVPAENVYVDNGKYKKSPLLHFSLLSYMQEKLNEKTTVFNVTAEGLTKKDVNKLKKLEKKLGFEHLRIYKTLNFAPYMFLGVLLTIIFKGNLFIVIF